jgi:hypothetical protein
MNENLNGPSFDLSALMTDQRAERKILENMEKSQNMMMGMPIGTELQPAAQQMAFNKACETGYFRLVNIRNVAMQTPQGMAAVPTAVYKMTETGVARLRELREREKMTARLGDAP